MNNVLNIQLAKVFAVLGLSLCTALPAYAGQLMVVLRLPPHLCRPRPTPLRIKAMFQGGVRPPPIRISKFGAMAFPLQAVGLFSPTKASNLQRLMPHNLQRFIRMCRVSQ